MFEFRQSLILIAGTIFLSTNSFHIWQQQPQKTFYDVPIKLNPDTSVKLSSLFFYHYDLIILDMGKVAMKVKNAYQRNKLLR